MVLVVLGTLLASPAYATSITIPYTFVPGTLIVSAQVNANFSTIASVVNGNLDNSNLSAGANISLSKLNRTQTFLDLQASGTTLGVGVGQTGDTIARIGMYGNGSLQWGAGGASATDIALQRTTANTLQLYVPGGGTPIFDFNNASVINIGAISGSAIGMVTGGRCYMTSGSPYADHAAATTIYYGPAISNQITLYNGTSEVTQIFSEASLAVGGLTAATVYDLYAKSLTASTISLTTTAWAGVNTPPTRGTQDGRLTKNGDATNLLVASFYLNGSSQTEDDGSSRTICNIYNPVPRALYAQIPVANWNYGVAAWRASDANTTIGQARVEVLMATVNRTAPDVTYAQCIQTGNSGESMANAIGLDTTTAPSSAVITYGVGAVGAVSYTGTNTIRYAPSSITAGYHYLQMLEENTGTACSGFGNGTGVTTPGDSLVGTTIQ